MGVAAGHGSLRCCMDRARHPWSGVDGDRVHTEHLVGLMPPHALYTIKIRAPRFSLFFLSIQGRMTPATRCRYQSLCWKNTSVCDLSELGLPDQTKSCDQVSSYCDLRKGICRATRIEYPKPNPCVVWSTMRSNPACLASKPDARRGGWIAVLVVSLLAFAAGAVTYLMRARNLQTIHIPDDGDCAGIQAQSGARVPARRHAHHGVAIPSGCPRLSCKR